MGDEFHDQFRAERMKTPRYEPQECYAGCEDPECPYSHIGGWYVGDERYDTEEEARAACRVSSH